MQTNPVLQKILATNYAEVESVIDRVVGNMCRKMNVSGEDAKDAAGQARLIYAQTYESFDPALKCTFAAFVYFHVSRKLYKYLREKRSYRNFVSYDEAMPTEVPALINTENFYEMIMRDELSADAQRMFRLIANPPAKLSTLSTVRADRILFTLSKYLTGLGWTADQCEHAYEELRIFFQRGIPAAAVRFSEMNPGCRQIRTSNFSSNEA